MSELAIVGEVIAVVVFIGGWYFFKGKMDSHIEEYKSQKIKTDAEIKELWDELDKNSNNDKLVSDRLIKLESSHSSMTETLKSIDNKMDKLFTMLEDRQKESALITERIIKLESKQ